jgi:single-strand DNA-binding protein
MASLNKVFLMGNLTRDPELRHTAGGTAMTTLSLAVNRAYNGKDGERREETLFVDVTVWDRQAELCCQYLKKGSGIHVDGSLKLDSWDDKTTGEKKTKLKVHAERIQFLDRRDGVSGEGEPAPAARRSNYEPRAATGGAAARPPASAPTTAPRRPSPPPPPGGDEEEDIPF